MTSLIDRSIMQIGARLFIREESHVPYGPVTYWVRRQNGYRWWNMLRCFIVDSETLSLAHKEQYVSKERSDSIDSFLFMKDKLNSYAAGLFMKAITDRYGGQIVYGENDKPYVSGNPIYFNISHSGHYVVCALSDSEVGIDIEEIGDHDDIAETVMVNSELSVYNSLPKEQKDTIFCRLWTSKESIMKLLGTGLTLEPKELTVLEKDGIVSEYKGMHLYPIGSPEGYCVTVCSYEKECCSELTVLSCDELIDGSFL